MSGTAMMYSLPQRLFQLSLTSLTSYLKPAPTVLLRMNISDIMNRGRNRIRNLLPDRKVRRNNFRKEAVRKEESQKKNHGIRILEERITDNIITDNRIMIVGGHQRCTT